MVNATRRLAASELVQDRSSGEDAGSSFRWPHVNGKLLESRDALAAEELQAHDDNMDVETVIELRR